MPLPQHLPLQPGNWAPLNDFLTVSLNNDGTLNSGAIPLVGNRIAAIGDSLTSSGYTASGAMPYATTSANAYLMWGCILSQGYLVFKDAFGGSGFTSAQVLATNVPLAVASKPSMCVVLAGTNDVGVTAQTTIYSNLSAIYTKLLAAGILPIASTIPPRNVATTPYFTQVTQLNAWIERNATKTGLPLIDFYSNLVNSATGEWITGYDLDGIHPSNTGAKKIGQILSDTLAGTSYLAGAPTLLPPAASTWMPMNNADTANLLQNGMMLTDSGAPVGRPTGWSLLSGAVGTETTSADPAWFGKAYQGAGIAKLGVSSASSVAVAGDLVFQCCRIGTTVEASGGTTNFAFSDTSGTQDYLVLSGFDKDIPNGSVLAYEFTMPATGNQRFRCAVQGLTNAGAQWRIGQVAALNLTTAGIS